MEARISNRKLRYVIEEENDAYVARCLDVEVTSDGDTAEEALTNLNEALALYFESDDGLPGVHRDGWLRPDRKQKQDR